MMSQDLFVEVSHGPTLIDHNILLSDVSLRFAAQRCSPGPQPHLRCIHQAWAGEQVLGIHRTTFRNRTEVMASMTNPSW